MCRKLTVTVIIFIALQMLLAGSASAADAWWSGSAGDYLWTSSGNWWPSGGAPVEDGNAHLDATLPLLCTINEDTNTVTTLDVFVGDWSQVQSDMSDPNMPILDVNNQTFNVTRNMYIALRETTYQASGVQAVGDVNVINGGIINVGGNLWVGSEGVGELNVRDGDVNIIGTLRCPGGPQPSYTGQRYTSGTGKINLYNGTIQADDIYCQANDTTQINIAGGALILNGDKTSEIADLISEGKIFAYGGDGNLEVDYDTINAGKTTITGTSDSNLASYPSPANYAKDVELDVDLGWTAGSGAISHDVYFGTVNPPPFIGNQTAVTYNPGDLGSEVTYYWRIDEVDSVTTHTGNVWKFTTKNPYIASVPSPINYKTQVPSSQVFSWTAGILADSHDVYMAMSYDDVNNATTSSSGIYRGTFATASYTPTDLLLGPKTYYWRVDEVNSTTSTVWKGKIWSFTTATYKLIDNFDTYTTTAGNRVYDLWKSSGGASTVSTATYFSDGETALLDYNAMKVTFDNSSLYYSEVNYTIPSTSSGAKRDWVSGGVAILGISIHGEPTNVAAAKLYVTVKDFNNHSVTVTYPDANQTVQRMDEYWSWWLIDLTKFSDGGVYLRKVKKLIIGLGDGVTASGSGVLYVDNVALYPRWCPEGFNASFDQSADADFNNDCMVNMEDFVLLVDSWLDSSYQVTASTPASTGLVIWYKFDDVGEYDITDYSGNGYDGYTEVASWDSTGYDGDGGFLFDASQSLFIEIPITAGADANLGGQSTIAFWAKEDAMQSEGTMYFQMSSAGQGDLQVWSEWPGDLAHTCGRYNSNGWQDSLFWGRYGFANPEYVIGQWNHFAFTKDYTTGLMRMYVNGKAVAEYDGALAETMPALSSSEDDFATLGAWRYNGGTGGYYTGIIDDFRLYKRALTDEEILSLADGSTITQPILSQANAVADSQVNFEDFAVMAARWMENPLLWP